MTIEGENLGLQVKEISHVQVAGVRCNTVTSQYVSAERIVCDMAEALLPHSPGGPVELCIGVCSADFRTLSTQTYSFVVSRIFFNNRKPSNEVLHFCLCIFALLLLC